MTSKFTEWYSKEIGKQLDENVPVEKIEIKVKVSVLKPLHASWLMEAYNHLTTAAGRGIIVTDGNRLELRNLYLKVFGKP